MSLDRKSVKKIIFILCAVVLFCAAIINLDKLWYGLKWFISLIMPILIGLAVAFIMSPLAEYFEKLLFTGSQKCKMLSVSKKAARILSVTIAFLAVLAVITLLVVLVIPQMRSAYNILVDAMPSLISGVSLWLSDMAGKFGIELDIHTPEKNIDWLKLSESLLDMFKLDIVAGDLFGGVIGVASSLFGIVFDLVMGTIIGFRLILQREAVGNFFRRFVKAYTSEKTTRHIFEVVRLCTKAFRNFISGQLTEAVVLGLMCCLGMTIFGFPYAVAASAIVGFCALIPVFGAWIGGIVGALLALTHSPLKALLFIVFIVCLQLVDNTFVYPRVVGSSMKLQGLLVFLAVLIGGSVAGVAGMLLGVPLCSVAYTLIKRSIDARLLTKSRKAAKSE